MGSCHSGTLHDESQMVSKPNLYDIQGSLIIILPVKFAHRCMISCLTRITILNIGIRDTAAQSVSAWHLGRDSN